MNIAIIGSGFLGEQLYRDISATSTYDEIILTHNTNKKYPHSQRFDFFTDDFKDILNGRKIDTVIISAMIEFHENPSELRDSILSLLEACQDSRIIYISSDGIFDGEKGLYKETDIPNPITVYGKNLQLCEDLIKKHSKNYCIVRPNYMYGFVNSQLDGRFKGVKKDIAEGNQISRFTDMYKSPLSYKQASKMIISLTKSNYQGIVHISGERKSVYEFTKEGMEALGLSTENLIGEPMPQKRPFNFLRDTSLNTTLVQQLTKIKPLSIKEGFKYSMEKPLDSNAELKKYLK